MTCNPKLRFAALAACAALALAAPLHAGANGATRALDLLARGNVSAARGAANAAVAADPRSATAQLAAARTALAVGDGVAAQAALERARAAGADMKAAAQWLAHARLLQGDARGALALARTAQPAHAAEALRIQARALDAMGNTAAAAAALDSAIAQAPNDSASWAALGRFRRAAGNVVGAMAAAARATALNPNNIDALALRAELVREQYGLVASLPWYEAALQRDPQAYGVLIDYAATLGDVGRAQEMLAVTRRALAVRPNGPQAMYLLAVLAARAGNSGLARDLLQNTGGALDGVPGPLLLGATLDIGDGADEQAVTKLRNLVALQPMNIRARQLLGVALLRLGATRDALDVLKPVALRGDADSYTLTLAARAFEALGERELAARYLDRAAHPGTAPAVLFGADESVPVLAAAAGRDSAGAPATAIPLIRALLDRGDRAGALARAQAVASASPGSPRAQVVLGDTLMMLGQANNAAAAYRRAATVNFDEPTMLRLTEALEQSGNRPAAAQALALYLGQNPGSIAGQRLAAQWQLAGGQYDAAVLTLEGLRARAGDRDAALLAMLATAYDGAGEREAATSFATAAYRLAPANAAAADAYGWALYGAGDKDGALQLLTKAATLAPDHAAIRWHLAQLYADLGRPDAARQHAQAALADPRFTDRERAERLARA